MQDKDLYVLVLASGHDLFIAAFQGWRRIQLAMHIALHVESKSAVRIDKFRLPENRFLLELIAN